MPCNRIDTDALPRYQMGSSPFLEVVVFKLLSSLVLVSNFVFAADATEVRVEAPCTADAGFAKEVASVTAVKTSKKVKRAKRSGHTWKTSYGLHVVYKSKEKRPQDFKLVSDGTGDEDFLEYSLQESDDVLAQLFIQGAVIQNQFKWVDLVDYEGSTFARCEPTKVTKK